MDVAELARGEVMTERPNTPPQPDDDGSAEAGAARDVAHAEGGRTRGETDVDDALGAGER
jgi:hypothetical protein